MGSLDDDHDTDWRAKYLEAADMLAETRAELDDFQHSSKDLEEELERELERTERAQEELKNKVSRAESERDDWKSRFMSLQTTHNTTTTSLQRELDQLRQTHHQLRSQMRELEIGNDDLEGRERAVSSSLADLEARYAKVLEEKILLEQELLDKASLEEEAQRLKDDVRDLNEEVFVLKEQLSDAKASAHLAAQSSSSLPPIPSRTSSTDENLLTTAPPDMLETDLITSEAPSMSFSPTSISKPLAVGAGQTAVLQKAGFLKAPGVSGISGLSRSSSMPSVVATTRLPARDPVRVAPRHNITAHSPSTRTNTIGGLTSTTTTKSKGVQMVSEMRARVRTLEQKLHSRVPRLRMGSVNGRQDSGSESTASVKEKDTSTAAKEKERERSTLKGAESPGWVLIMEDSTPQPNKISRRQVESAVSRRSADSGESRSSFDQHRVGTPSDMSAPTSFRPSQSTYTPSTSSSASSSGLRRPQSRLSASTDGRSSIGSTISTLSSATTTSRPTTPTFLPVPSSFRTSSTTTPMPSSAFNGRRSSLGLSSNNAPTSRNGKERPTSVPMGGKPFANGLNKSQIGTPRATGGSKELPPVPPVPPLPSAPSPNPLAQSRIGRPAPSAYSRRPAYAQDDASPAPQNGNLKASTRLRAGSFKQ